jgi:hypothetical protein
MFTFARKLYEHFLRQVHAVEYGVEFVNSIPADSAIDNNKIYLIGEKSYFKWALMKCPCGCEETLIMSIMKKIRPFWTVKFDRYKRISLSPSVWKKNGCSSHFFVKKGKIIWTENLDELI